jgi:hypothetical protein
MIQKKEVVRCKKFLAVSTDHFHTIRLLPIEKKDSKFSTNYATYLKSNANTYFITEGFVHLDAIHTLRKSSIDYPVYRELGAIRETMSIVPVEIVYLPNREFNASQRKIFSLKDYYYVAYTIEKENGQKEWIQFSLNWNPYIYPLKVKILK